MKKLFVFALALSAVVAFGQELKIDYQLNLAAPDAGNYFTFSGPTRYMDSGASRYNDPKDGLGKPDATSHASKYHSTEFFNHYQYDVMGKQVIPSGLRGLFLYPIAVDAQRNIDNLQVATLADGSIQIRYVHRGSAYEFVTDKKGQISFPGTTFRTRVIGHTDNTIHPDFSSDGKVTGVDWNKVWNSSIPGGKQVGTAKTMTGAIVTETPARDALFGYKGTLQASFDGTYLKIAGTLKIVK